MRSARITHDDLRQRLRLAGVTRLDQVRCVVLERNGEMSILQADNDIDPRLLADIQPTS